MPHPHDTNSNNNDFFTNTYSAPIDPSDIPFSLDNVHFDMQSANQVPSNSNQVLTLSLDNDEIPSNGEEIQMFNNSPIVTNRITEKVSRFKALHVISGNQIGDQLESYIKSHYGDDGLHRYRLSKFILTKLHYRVSKDTLLMLSCNKPAKVVIATAGAGKTTSLQFDIVIYKILDSLTGSNRLKPLPIEGTDVKLSRVLYLNYNRHNMDPIIKKHQEVCQQINSLIGDVHISPDIDSKTVHSFCKQWLQAASNDENIDYTLPSSKVIEPFEKEQIWSKVIEPRYKKFYGENKEMPADIFNQLDELYNYRLESKLSWEDFYLSAKFVDSGYSEEFVQSSINAFDRTKRLMGKMDFIDYVVEFINLIGREPKLLNKLQDRYSLIIADENQDFTALYNDLLLALHNPNKNKLIAVGDPDQVIYSFKGVSPVNMVDLIENLPDVDTIGLDTNYRCPNNIIDAAKKILNINMLRFDKPIGCVHQGGLIQQTPYKSDEHQCELVLNLLRRMSPEELSNTVVCYRNNKSAMIIGEEMYYSDIPFKVIDSNRPFSNMYFVQVYNIFLALQYKDNIELNKNLFRILPIKRSDWLEIIEFNRMNRRYHLEDLQFNIQLSQHFLEVYSIVLQLTKVIEIKPCKDYSDILIGFYRRFYLDFLIKTSRTGDYTSDAVELILSRIVKFFSQDKLFSLITVELNEKNTDRPNGVTLSTFHGLKGLEFNNVIAIDFNESIFPNWERIDMSYSASTALEEREAENRLAYVLVTRAIKRLYFFYQEDDPSIYLRIMQDMIDNTPSSECIDLDLGTNSPSTSHNKSFSDKMDFINRMLGN